MRNYHYYNPSSFFPFLLDPPEIEIEQNWYQRDGEDVEVELICVVHAKPEGEVLEIHRILYLGYKRTTLLSLLN